MTRQDARSGAMAASLFVAACASGPSNAPGNETPRDRDLRERKTRMEKRVGRDIELEPAPGGGELGAPTGGTVAQPPDPNRLDSSTVPMGGQATEDHQLLYCPTATNSPLRDLWFTYADRDVVGVGDCSPGTSASYLWTVLDLPPGGDCVVGWSGVVTDDFLGGFAGVGAELAQPDLSGVRAISVRMRGQGTPVRLEIGFRDQLSKSDAQDCRDGARDLFGAVLACGDGTDAWVTHEVPLSKLAQEGWGDPFTPTWSDVAQLQLRVAGVHLPDEAREAPADRTLRGVRTDGFVCDFEVVSFI